MLRLCRSAVLSESLITRTVTNQWSTTRTQSSNVPNIKDELPGQAKPGWTTIYRFPYIGIISALNRTKWYQLGATVIASPVAYGMEMAGEFGPGTAIVCGIVGLCSTIATTAFSKLSSGTVGFFYLNQEDTTARFGYVDSNGKRQDVLCPVDDLESISENRFFLRLAVPSGDSTPSTRLKLFHSHGIISDVGKFNQTL